MRTGASQKSPTSKPLVSVVVAGDTHTTRVVRAGEDEQVWGGNYIIELDNSDEALNAKDYEGKPITLNHAFSTEAGSDLAPLWVFTQAHDSRQGKLILRLNCIDIWGLLSMVTSTVGAEYWNYPEQAPGEPYEDATHYNKTILQIITSVISDAVGKSVVLDDDDGIINSQTPPIRIANARTGVRQLLEMTECFLLWKGDSKFHVIKPDAHATAYSYDVANLIFSSIVEAGVTIPNRVIYHGTDSGGNLISGVATDATSYGKIGIYIDRHYYYSEDEIRLLTTQAQVDTLSASTLAKIQGERNQGLLIAPMHCAQELFDKISVTDSRYGTPAVTTGYVHRIVREYDRGIYRITLYLGGVTSGFTPDGGGIPIPLVDKDTPTPLTTALATLPPGVQAYIADIDFTSVDYNTISWTSGTIQFADGRTLAINAGSLNLTTTHYLYWVWGNPTLQNSTSYSDAVGDDRGLVAVASKGSTTDQKAYVLNPHTDSILINRDKVMDNLVNELKLADNAISTAKLQNLCIVAGKIQTNAITSAKIYAGAITAVKIDAHAVDATKLAATIILGTTIWAGSGQVKLDSGGIKVYGLGNFNIYHGTSHLGVVGGFGSEFQLVASAGKDLVLAASNWGDVIFRSGGLGSFRPTADNYEKCGTASYRWKDVYCVTLHQGDSVFSNGWRLTESKDNKGIRLLRPDGSVAKEWR